MQTPPPNPLMGRLTELLFLGITVGLIPELLVDGLKDAFGPCPCQCHAAQCIQITQMGFWQLAAAFVCVLISVVLVMIIAGLFDEPPSTAIQRPEEEEET